VAAGAIMGVVGALIGWRKDAPLAGFVLGLLLGALGWLLGFFCIEAQVITLHRAIVESAPAATSKADGGPQAAESATVRDSRTRWLNLTYDQTIAHGDGKAWIETRNATGEVTSRLTETARTPEYVELSGFNFGVGRIFSQRLEMKKGDNWEWVSNGRWVDAEAKP
jgi:xanthosine utilization system XapX-like protein